MIENIYNYPYKSLRQAFILFLKGNKQINIYQNANKIVILEKLS